LANWNCFSFSRTGLPDEIEKGLCFYEIERKKINHDYNKHVKTN